MNFLELQLDFSISFSTFLTLNKLCY